ncbi:hypothetical protein [Pseudomonas sp. RIT-PI-S]|uniref:hypothetical protein n=1 Tax=Pseudomonas sp. RIT-PI-S TaxID=3035295 RepID=UPI0021DA4DBE|nr:hypothetical protein [Pseudomonas sp. RIT-PI-S]
MVDKYRKPNSLTWGLVLLAVAFWGLALLMLSVHFMAAAAALFLLGLSMIWPGPFYGRRGADRFHCWFHDLWDLFRFWR